LALALALPTPIPRADMSDELLMAETIGAAGAGAGACGRDALMGSESAERETAADGDEGDSSAHSGTSSSFSKASRSATADASSRNKRSNGSLSSFLLMEPSCIFTA